MKKILIILGLLLISSIAQAQTSVITIPKPVTAVDNESSSVVTTNTFQQIFPASTANVGRVACVVQNTGTNPMYVYFGATADATIAKSVKLVAGQACTCDVNNIVIKTAVQITGTTTETYYAAQQ